MPEIDERLAYLHSVTNGKERHLVRLISIFLETIPDQLESLYKELESANEVSESARKIIHKLRPALQSMGMENTVKKLQDMPKGAKISKRSYLELKVFAQEDWRYFFNALEQSYGKDLMNQFQISDLP